MTATAHGSSGADLDAIPEAPMPSTGPEIARLVAARGFFAGPVDTVPDDVYSVARGPVVRRRDRAVLGPWARLSLDTYSGRFPASYWQRWTSVQEVVLEVTCRGAGTLCVRASDGEGEPRTVLSRGLDAATSCRLDIPVDIDRFVDGGALWVEFTTETQSLDVEDVRWSVEAPSAVRPTAVVICTYNRADDCLSTLSALAADPDARRMVDAVYVIDQGDDTVESRPGFADVAALLAPTLHYRRQANLGGAGGFTRGLYEVADVERAGWANVLFMDDDIRLEPDVIVRLTAFANRTVEPVIVGAQMLHLLHPTKLHVSAETARFTTIEPGLAVEGGLDKADVTKKMQDRRVDAEYNAWWTCLLPSEIVDAVGYPMPFFFQWDDVEFGYRARAHGFATVTLPNAGVWHHDFDWKDEDDWARYFTLRNALMIDALHGDFRPRSSALVAGRWIAECVASMRYGQAATLIRAVEDFLRGPESLRDGGAGALADVRALRARYPETRVHRASMAPGAMSSANPLTPAGPTPSAPTAVLAKRLLTQWRGRAGGTVSIGARDASWWHVGRFSRAVVTDRSQQGVRVRESDPEQVRALARRAAVALWRLDREGLEARDRLREAVPELTGRAFWQRLFGVSSE